MTRASNRKLRAYRLGLYAEWRAVLYGWMRGYRLIAHRLRTPHGEIDLIMARGKTIIFIEVKARATREEGLYALQPKQQQRIIRAATSWLARHPKYAGHHLRFDLMVVERVWRLHHLPHAYTL